MRDAGLSFGEIVLIIFIAGVLMAIAGGIWEYTRQKRAGMRAKREPGSGFLTAVGLICFMKVLLLIVFFPFAIIWAGVKKG